MKTKDEVLMQHGTKVAITQEEYENAERIMPPDEFVRKYQKTEVRTPKANWSESAKDMEFDEKISYFRYEFPKEQDLLYNMVSEIERKVSFIYVITVINVVLFFCSLLLTMCGGLL